MDLSGVVILFDEMDALAQTRVNAALDVTRQLLTTSMLPKLADLYDRARVIFLMATNHKKDLDAAITRPGRFDLLLCVGPPTWEGKLKGIRKALKGLAVGDFDTVGNLLTSFTDGSTVRDQLNLFTVGDLRSFVENIRRRAKAKTLQLALQSLGKAEFQKDVSDWAKSYITLASEKRHDGTEIDALTEYESDKNASRIQ
jgi:SpoVK/Ycf46/Vps4 family AAA+-type ATPase